MFQQTIPNNLAIRKHLLEYLHVEDGRNWGVNRSKISKHHLRKHCACRLQTPGAQKHMAKGMG